MSKVSSFLIKISVGWVVLAALIVFLAFTALVLPGQAAKAEQASGNAGSPDTSFFYSASQLYGLAQSYGEEGRQAYIVARWTFDLVFPLVYGAFLITGISWLSLRIYGRGTLAQYANLVPVLGVLFDFLENTATSIVMARFPSESKWIAHLATIFTPVKWAFVIGSFVVLLWIVLVAGRRWIQKRLA